MSKGRNGEVTGSGILIDLIGVLAGKLNFTYDLVDGQSEMGVVKQLAQWVEFEFGNICFTFVRGYP